MDKSGMMVEDERIEYPLERLVGSITREPALRDDLLQEARLHLWRVKTQFPGRSTSWYIQSCRFRIQHYLAAGRSVDSAKRRSHQLLPDLDEDWSEFLDQFPDASPGLEEAFAHDLVLTLAIRLNVSERAVLAGLAAGLAAGDIARRLKLSYPTVTKYRRKIARLVIRLGIAAPHLSTPTPPPNGTLRSAHRASRSEMRRRRPIAHAASTVADPTTVAEQHRRKFIDLSGPQV
jgi:DNA-directed RNA polymerase specialized sigma24 family protein